MNCRIIKNNLSAYQDKNLPEEKMLEIKNHLQMCSECFQSFAELDFTWEVLGQVEKFDSAPFFWTRLSQRIEEKENRKSLINPLQWFPIPVVTTAFLIFAFIVGVYFGKTIFHQSTSIQQTTIEQEVNGFLTTNSLDEYTGESLPDAYVSLMSENMQ
ncbi:zf-HC2 domain-containing protein [candidate division KSB1 bacterium]|nr:zf-HC2 domain-containing protein [candidate division KSB1 bacterium]MBL7093604.1 zf-HC2 domain-containing protein [candidate division KSB1 bacterium]